MIFITIIFSVAFVAYNVFIYRVYGPLWSISASYYELETEKNDTGWMFTLFLTIISAWLVAVIVVTGSVFFMLAAGGAFFTGVATMYKNKGTRWVHYGGSALMVIAASIGCWLSFSSWWVIPAVILSALALFVLYKKNKVDNPLYWSEHAAFIWIVLGTLI